MKLIKGRTFSDLLANERPDTVELLRIFDHVCQAVAAAHDEAGFFEDRQMLGDRDTGHAPPGSEGEEGLAIVGEQGVEQVPAGGVGERSKHCFHTVIIGNQIVSCQGDRLVQARYSAACPPDN